MGLEDGTPGETNQGEDDSQRCSKVGRDQLLDLSSDSRTGGTVTGMHRSFRTYCRITKKKIVLNNDNGAMKSMQQLPS